MVLIGRPNDPRAGRPDAASRVLISTQVICSESACATAASSQRVAMVVSTALLKNATTKSRTGAEADLDVHGEVRTMAGAHAMTGAAGNVPVRIESVEESDGGVEVFVELGGFKAASASFPTDIEFKASCLESIESARQADAPARTGRRVGAKRRAICKILADFNLVASNKFEIINR